MRFRIAALPGDGIGPEVVEQACAVLNKVGQVYGHNFEFKEYIVGGAAIDQFGEPLPEETLAGCLASDSVLLGAVGGPSGITSPAASARNKLCLGSEASSDSTPICGRRYCIGRLRMPARCGRILSARALILWSCGSSREAFISEPAAGAKARTDTKPMTRKHTV